MRGWRRGVAQLGSASALGAEGRRFKSCHPDQDDPADRLGRAIRALLMRRRGRRVDWPRIGGGSARRCRRCCGGLRALGRSARRCRRCCGGCAPWAAGSTTAAPTTPTRGVPHVKSTVEDLSPTRVRLAVEVPFDELKPASTRRTRRSASRSASPASARARCPPASSTSASAAAPSSTEVVKDASRRCTPRPSARTRSACSASPRSRSPSSTTARPSRSPPRSTSRPELKLPDLDDLAVTVDDVEVTDEDIDEQVAALRERFGTLTGVERAGRGRRLRLHRPRRPRSTARCSRTADHRACPTRSAPAS